MGPVDDTKEAYSLDCYFRQSWTDKRLSYNTTGLKTLALNWAFLAKIWVGFGNLPCKKSAYLWTQKLLETQTHPHSPTTTTTTTTTTLTTKLWTFWTTFYENIQVLQCRTKSQHFYEHWFETPPPAPHHSSSLKWIMFITNQICYLGVFP